MKSIADEIIEIDKWKTPASSYPRRKYGTAEIRTAIYKRDRFWHCYGQAPEGHPDPGGYLYWRSAENIPVTTLRIGRKTWMVDDPPHYWTIQRAAKLYSGHVVVAGLGLGLVVHALDANPAVTRITVVERKADVIRLVKPLVPRGKLKVICGDFWKKMPDQREADGVFFDIWVGKTHGMLAEAVIALVKIKRAYRQARVFRILGFPDSIIGPVSDIVIANDLRPEQTDNLIRHYKEAL